MAGQPLQKTWGNGRNTTYAYHPQNLHLTRLQVSGSLLDLRYGYDLAGNVVAIQDASVGETLRFAYDSFDRLTIFESAQTPFGTVTIKAKGSNVDGWPLMQYGVVVQEWMVNSTDYADYTAQAPLSGDDRVDVAFVNDHCVATGCANGDRNLWVDYVFVNGQKIQAESTTVQYDRGAGEGAYDGRDVIPGQEGMYWNGALRMRVTTGNPWTGRETYAYGPTGNLLSKAGLSYTYGDSSHVHAVTGLSNGWLFTYDANGNMTTRVEGGVTYKQEFDDENRLTVVTNTATGQVTRLWYDGDGNRTKKVENGQTTVYVGEHFEKSLTTGVVRSYYYAVGQRIAMRVGSTVTYLHTDHLGSTSLATGAGGVVVAQQRYYPYGGVRWAGGTLPTQYLFTGQRREGLAYTTTVPATTTPSWAASSVRIHWCRSRGIPRA